MSLGTSIFLSSVVLAIAAIFIATKDRWNWKKLTLWSVGAGCLIALVAYAYTSIQQRPKKETSFGDIPLGATKADVKFLKGEPTEGECKLKLDDLQHPSFKSLPSAEQAKGRTEIYNCLMENDEAVGNLPASERAKVVGLSSPPTQEAQKTQSTDSWTYVTYDSGGSDWEHMYLVQFEDGKVSMVFFVASSNTLYGPGIQGIDIGNSSKMIFEKFGTPSNVSTSRNELLRMYSFNKYGIAIEMKANRVVGYGVFDTALRPNGFRYPSEKNGTKKPGRESR